MFYIIFDPETNQAFKNFLNRVIYVFKGISDPEHEVIILRNFCGIQLYSFKE